MFELPNVEFNRKQLFVFSLLSAVSEGRLGCYVFFCLSLSRTTFHFHDELYTNGGNHLKSGDKLITCWNAFQCQIQQVLTDIESARMESPRTKQVLQSSNLHEIKYSWFVCDKYIQINLAGLSKLLWGVFLSWEGLNY